MNNNMATNYIWLIPEWKAESMQHLQSPLA
jgi:hypothetical protein